MSEQPFKWLSWRNRFTKHLIQPLDGVDCFQESVLLNPENNLIVLNLSEAQFLQMFSALMTGAEISYPDESLQLVANFLKGIQCPPTLVPEECITLPTYANNIAYSPANPFIEPNFVPDGYLMQPFLVNGQNGNDFPTYEPLDVVVPFDAITFDLNFFEDISGQLPTLEIMVQGTGSVNIKFLTTVQGGLVVVTLDNPPNLLDILSGIVTGSENIVDLNQDLVSLPPETAKELIYPVSIETGGIHTIYAVFLPILDDSLIPIRFGGGFRGLELCGFLPEGDMGLQNLRFVSCNLEQQNSDGSWSIVDGWEDWLECVPTGGGGGSSAAAKVTPIRKALGVNDFTTTSTTLTGVSGSVQAFTTTYPVLVLRCHNVAINNDSANDSEFRINIQGETPDAVATGRMTGTSRGELSSVIIYNNLTPGTYNIELLARSIGGGTTTIERDFQPIYVIEEYMDISALFVEDIRITGNELQKKVAGAWVTVADSLATILSGIQAIASNALTVANGAVAVNNTQNTQISAVVTVNNTQNTRLNNAEAAITDLELSVAQHNLDIASLDSRLDVLEAMNLGQQEFWSREWDLLSGLGGWTSTNGSWVSGQGLVMTGGATLNYPSVTLFDNRVTHLKLEWRKSTGGFGTISLEFTNTDGFSVARLSGGGNLNQAWFKVPNYTSQPNTLQFVISNFSHELKIEKIRLLGRGVNLFP